MDSAGEAGNKVKRGLRQRLFGGAGLRPRELSRRFLHKDVSSKVASGAVIASAAAPADGPAEAAAAQPSGPGTPESSTDLPVGATPARSSAGPLKRSRPSWLEQHANASLFVQLINAEGLPAADSNGLSDPYVQVQVGSHRAQSSTRMKTLNPEYNETFVFAPADVQDALDSGRPRVQLLVYDWDLVSADDFLGQAELSFEQFATQQGPAAFTLSLYAHKGDRKEHAGHVRLSAWFGHQQESPSRSGAPAAAVSTLCFPAGTARSAPLVVHAGGCWLYEEPLMACLAITLRQVQGVSVPGAPGTPQGGLARQSLSNASDLSAGSSTGGNKPLGAALRGFFARKKEKAREKKLQVARSKASTTSSGGIGPGEDPGDEIGAFDFMPNSIMPARADYTDQPGMVQAMRSDTAESEAMVVVSGPSLSADSITNDTWPTAVRGSSADTEEAILSGKLLYVKLILGSQEHVSYVRKERRDGSVTLDQSFVFAVPVPMRNRKMRVELYRTNKSSSKGRIISMAEFELFSLLPDTSADLLAVRESRVRLTSLHKGQKGGEVILSTALVDTDLRRQMYRQPFTELPPVVADTSIAGEVAQPQAHHPQPSHLERLESRTPEYTARELKKKAQKGESEYHGWQGSWHHQARLRLRANWDWLQDYAAHAPAAAKEQLKWLLGGEQGEGGGQEGEAEAEAAVAEEAVPEAPATLRLKLSSLVMEGATPAMLHSDVFVMLKCGPYWGKSRMQAVPGASLVPLGWEVELPVLDPATLLLVAVFIMPRKGLYGRLDGHTRPGILLQNPAQMMGKLRVRLSCVSPGQPVSADLPLLSERLKGAKRVGYLALSLQVSFRDHKAMLKSYITPPLPKAAYYLGTDGAAHQKVMQQETRRIVLRWLRGTNPAIKSEEAMALLDTEREKFAMSRLKVNWRRIQMVLAAARRFSRWFNRTCKEWENPAESWLVVAALVSLCFFPRVVIPLLLAWLIWATMSADYGYTGLPPSMEHDPPGVEESNVELEAKASNPVAILKQKLDALQRLGLTVQNILDDVASALERLQAILTFEDPTATFIVLGLLGIVALLFFLLGGAPVMAFTLFWIVRPPRLRTPTPPAPAVLFKRLPCRADRVM